MQKVIPSSNSKSCWETESGRPLYQPVDYENGNMIFIDSTTGERTVAVRGTLSPDGKFLQICNEMCCSKTSCDSGKACTKFKNPNFKFYEEHLGYYIL